jgi:nucleolar GTP-binding protein
VEDILNRLHVAQPPERDSKERPAFIPNSVLMSDTGVEKKFKRTERDLELENGGAGVYSADLKKFYLLANSEEKYDKIPEFKDGHNVADFVDPDIEARLEELEREEEELAAKYAEEQAEMSSSLDEEEEDTIRKIREKKALLKAQGTATQSRVKAKIPKKLDRSRTLEGLAEHLDKFGKDGAAIVERIRARSSSRPRPMETDGDEGGGDAMMTDEPAAAASSSSKTRTGRSTSATKGSRTRSVSAGTRPAPGERGRKRTREEQTRGESAEGLEGSQAPPARSRSRSRSISRGAEVSRGLHTQEIKLKATLAEKRGQAKIRRLSKASESDRAVPNPKPKHLFSGKRKAGKTDRR